MTDATNGEALIQLLCELYYSAYHAGHHDTVEGQYTDVFPCDAKTYHRETVEEWLSEHQPPTASAGMVVVPREPTEAMLDAMARTGVKHREWCRDVYDAMLAAHESQSPNRQAREDSQGLGEPGRLPPEKLAEFARWVLEQAGDGGDIEGCDAQEEAERLGLIVKVEATEPCSEIYCSCAEVVGEFPCECYRYVPGLFESPNADTTPDVSERGQFIEAMDQLVSDFYKYQEGDPKVPFAVIRDAIVVALDAYQSSRKHLPTDNVEGE